MTVSMIAGVKHISEINLEVQPSITLTGAQRGIAPMEKAGLAVLVEEIT